MKIKESELVCSFPILACIQICRQVLESSYIWVCGRRPQIFPVACSYEYGFRVFVIVSASELPSAEQTHLGLSSWRRL